jgi:hypothetical protein
VSTTPQGWQNPKTNWQAADIVHPSDFNRIEGNIQSIESGSRTLDPSQVPSGNTGSLRQILSWFANRIRAITGMANWYDAPPTTLAATSQAFDAHESDASAHHARYTDAEAIAAVWGAAGAGSGLDADKLRGLIPGNNANNLLKLGADGKVPLANLPPIQTRFLYAGDETECSVKGTTQVAVKTLRVVKSASAGMDIKKLSFVATLKTNGGTGYLRVYVDGTSRATLSTASTGYVVVTGEYAPQWADNTVHTLEVRLNNSSASYTTYNQVFEVYVE